VRKKAKNVNENDNINQASLDAIVSKRFWLWKPFQQCSLAWWIFVASFIEVPSLSRDIASNEISVNGQTTDGRTTGKHNASAAYYERMQNK